MDVIWILLDARPALQIAVRCSPTHIFEQSVKSEASKWPGYGQMTEVVNNGELDANGRKQPTDTASPAALSTPGKRGRLDRTGASGSGAAQGGRPTNRDDKYPWSAHVAIPTKSESRM